MNPPKPVKKSLVIRREWCKGCGICVAFCPTQVLGLDEEAKVVLLDPKGCTRCGLCELRCPDLAMELVKTPEPDEEQEEVAS